MGIRAGVVCLAVLSGSVIAQPTTWDGDAGDGLWISQQNWDTDIVPGISSQVMIPSDAGTVQIILSSEACSSLDCLSSLRLTTGSIDVSGSSTVTNMIFDGGGGVPTVFTEGSFIISGNSSCNVGQVFGSGSFNNAGIFDVLSFGYDAINGSNTGTWNMQPGGSSLNLSNGAEFTNSGTFTLQPDAVIGGPNGMFINSGTLSRTGGAGTTNINFGLTQSSGSISVSGIGAAVSINSDAWNISGGSLSVSNGGRLLLIGTNVAATRSLGATSISGNGAVDVFPANATINWAGSTDTNVTGTGLTAWAGTLNIAGAISNTGLWVGRGSTLSGTGSFDNESGGTVEVPISNSMSLKMPMHNEGTVDLFGSLFLDDNIVLENFLGTIQLHDGSVVGSLTPATRGAILNVGNVELVGDESGATSTIDSKYNSDKGGALLVNNATLHLTGGGVLSGGVVNLFEDLLISTLHVNGTATEPYSVTGDYSIGSSAASLSRMSVGTINGFGPTVDVSATLEIGTKTDFNGGEITGAGKIEITHDINWFGGSIGVDVDMESNVLSIRPATGKVLKSKLAIFEDNASVAQSGSFTLQGGTVDSSSSWVMSNGSSILMSGSGNMFNNYNEFSVDDPNFGTHIISAPFNNTRLVFVKKGHLFLTGDVTQFEPFTGTLTGGEWAVEMGSSLNFTSELIQLHGPGVIRGGTAEMPQLGSLERMDNAASARLLDSVFNGSLGLSGGSELTAAGDVTVHGDYTSKDGSRTTIEPGAKIEATGSMTIGEVDSAADEINVVAVLARNGKKRGAPLPSIVTPLLEVWGRFGVDESGSSVIGMQGDLLMRPSSRLHVSMVQSGPGTNTMDVLNIIGSATIDGTLADYTIGEELIVLIASEGITGAFDDVQVVGLGSGEGFIASIVGIEVRITATASCIADLTGDGSLNFFDVSAFLAAFAAQDPIADFSGDGLFNFFDVSAFLGAFVAGCP
ncbi:MAG: hypothetical protein JKX70_10365 [Phycisphaerales bacterium]|nr:hypothetical protein [Phycisphaerales bacterium]